MKIKKILIFLTIILLALSINQVVYGASAKLSVDNEEIEVEKTATITIKADNAASWNLNLTSSGGNLAVASKIALAGTSSTGENCSDTITTATFSAAKAGEYTITLSGQAVDFDETSSKVSTTLKIKVTEPPAQEEPKEDTTVEQPKEDTPTEGPKEDTPAEQPKEEAPTEQPKEDTPAEQPKEESPAQEEPKEDKPVEQPEQKEPEKSSNNKLKMLGIKPNDFRNFKPTTTTYYITVPYEVSKVNVYADKAEDSQTISGTGDVELKEGKNTVRVVCTAEDGTTKTYTMYITREAEVIEEPEVEEPQEPETPDEEEPKEDDTTPVEDITENVEDKAIGIAGLNIVAKTEEGKELLPELSPAFAENVYEYMLAVPLTVKDVEITAQTEAGTPEIEVMGNKQLAEGENLVTVIVKLGEDTKVYQINVVKSEQITETVLSNEIIMQLAMIAGVATIIIVGIVAIIIMIVKSKKKDKTPRIEQPKTNNEEMPKEETEKIESKIE